MHTHSHCKALWGCTGVLVHEQLVYWHKAETVTCLPASPVTKVPCRCTYVCVLFMLKWTPLIDTPCFPWCLHTPADSMLLPLRHCEHWALWRCFLTSDWTSLLSVYLSCVTPSQHSYIGYCVLISKFISSEDLLELTKSLCDQFLQPQYPLVVMGSWWVVPGGQGTLLLSVQVLARAMHVLVCCVVLCRCHTEAELV